MPSFHTARRILTGLSRCFARARRLLERPSSKPKTKEEYRESILQRARLRRELLEKQPALQDQVEAALSTEEDAEVDETELKDASEALSDREEEDDTLEERDLFLRLLDHREAVPVDRPRRYLPFEPSDDDDEHRTVAFALETPRAGSCAGPKKEESFVSKWFNKMEEENAIAKRESQAVYEEEEVAVKLVHFDEDEEKAPVRLVLSQPPAKERATQLCLRKADRVESTKTKLFVRKNVVRVVVSKRLEVGGEVERPFLESLQRLLDVLMVSGNEALASTLYTQIERHPMEAFSHLQWLCDRLPASVSLLTVSRRLPEALFHKNRSALDMGFLCSGALYPCLHLFEKTFRLGLCRVELLEDVFRLGKTLDTVRRCFSESMSASEFRAKLEDARVLVPNFAKVVESCSATVKPSAIAAVLEDPALTRSRLEACKKRVYNWRDFNLYAYADFTLSRDEAKFERFCEMYNATRRLQRDFAEKPSDPEQGGIHDALYFWKQNWMRGEHHTSRDVPNGVLPHQFTSMYAAFELLELEGLEWSAFLQGLSVLSEQRDVGVYEELRFYEKLRASRRRDSASQISVEREPLATETPLFEVTPIHREAEIFY